MAIKLFDTGFRSNEIDIERNEEAEAESDVIVGKALIPIGIIAIAAATVLSGALQIFVFAGGGILLPAGLYMYVAGAHALESINEQEATDLNTQPDTLVEDDDEVI